MSLQWVRVTRGFWHAGKAWGEGEVLQVEANTANLLRGNQNVVPCDPPAPVAAGPLVEVEIDNAFEPKKLPRGKAGA